MRKWRVVKMVIMMKFKCFSCAYTHTQRSSYSSLLLNSFCLFKCLVGWFTLL